MKAAKLCPKVCGQDSKRWEDWIFAFAHQGELKVSETNAKIKLVKNIHVFTGHHTIRTHGIASSWAFGLRDDPRVLSYS